MSSVQPGWYPDNTGMLRWWDGQQWTAYTQPAPAPQPQHPAPLPPAQHQIVVPPAGYAPQYPPVQQVGAPARLRHQGAAWAVGAVVLLAVLSSGIALGVVSATARPAAETGGVAAQDPGSSEDYAPLVTHEPVSAEQAALLESTVEKYNVALSQKDCAGFTAATSANYRAEYTGECVPGFFDGADMSGYSSVTLSATETGRGLYELRVDESFTYNGEPMTARYAYVLTDDPTTGLPVIEMIVDRN